MLVALKNRPEFSATSLFRALWKRKWLVLLSWISISAVVVFIVSRMEPLYSAESLVLVKNYGKKEVDTDFSGPMGFFKLMQAMMGGESSSVDKRGKKIAVVYAVGPIMSGKSESGFMGSETVGSTTIIEALRKANEDKQVVAIVLSSGLKHAPRTRLPCASRCPISCRVPTLQTLAKCSRG